MLPILTGYDITLRPLEENDLPKLWEITTPETFQFMMNPVTTYEEFEIWLMGTIRAMNESGDSIVFAVHDHWTNQLAGSTRMYLIDEQNKNCEIGATFYGDQFRRTHVNTAAKLVLLTEAFEKRHYIRVQLRTDEKNIASQRAIERIGAKKEGLLRNERIRANGVIRNAYLYSILPAEWISIKQMLEEKLNNYT
ncbi:GNAT family N-acetyltransferase [Paenisporosarcina cavernae]|uniref:N-acetyltransferase n=1 Tax=Paenisporosarcina cavernae TaxID=2320858 RepID=A0A385YV50_9BACL|nr:GNAT family N-acetyltransferase [Paenisporosarcina cavernae]AYC30566.1 N-acetyltransferase [Paenisporosarcina cavernae]